MWLPLIALATARLGELATETLLKQGIGRPRPALEPALTTATGFSFPSGHTAGTAAVACVLALLLLGVHQVGRRRAGLLRWGAVVIVTGVIVATVACSRVLLGVHYPSDVLGGALLGTACALLAVAEAAHRWEARTDT
ncbi:phosphatase PAP2 family protein [Pseudonocardia sp. N23]|uniref:phosphatase PAP2 family protein n=1 Tax=Pseudonocardia sp. N23 TaxID=1987376 RepID=UPI000BFE78E2